METGTVFNTTTLTAFNASHTYSLGGTYTVNETAANPYSTNTTSLSNYITVYNQTVSGFTGDANVRSLPTDTHVLPHVNEQQCVVCELVVGRRNLL